MGAMFEFEMKTLLILFHSLYFLVNFNSDNDRLTIGKQYRLRKAQVNGVCQYINN